MIGPTGVGKTEIARRLARLAMRFHQGPKRPSSPRRYVRPDVDTIVRDSSKILDQGHSRSGDVKKVDAERRIRRGAGARRPATSGTPDGPLRGGRCRANRPSAAGRRVRDAGRSFGKNLREASSTTGKVEIEVSAQQAHMEIFPRPEGGADASIPGMFRIWAAAGENAPDEIREAMRMLTDEEARAS